MNLDQAKILRLLVDFALIDAILGVIALILAITALVCWMMDAQPPQ